MAAGIFSVRHRHREDQKNGIVDLEYHPEVLPRSYADSLELLTRFERADARRSRVIGQLVDAGEHPAPDEAIQLFKLPERGGGESQAVRPGCHGGPDFAGALEPSRFLACGSDMVPWRLASASAACAASISRRSISSWARQSRSWRSSIGMKAASSSAAVLKARGPGLAVKARGAARKRRAA